MTVSIIKKNSDSITLQVTIAFNRSMLDSEHAIQEVVNEMGGIATGELLKTFDTEGEDIVLGAAKMTSKGLSNKCYQTPYGEIEIERHIYQSTVGGTTFCPLEREARIILTSTPRFASQISHKADGAHDNWEFLEKHTNKQTLDFYHATEYLTDVSDKVFIDPIKRKAWLNDRCHQLKHTKDAAVSILSEMEKFLNDQILDPNVSSLTSANNSMLPNLAVTAPNKKNREQHKKSLEAAITYFKNNVTAPPRTKNRRCEERSFEQSRMPRLSGLLKATLLATTVLSFLGEGEQLQNNNQKSRMNYWESVAENHVIGSGVTEAACKTIVKQRLCKSGMRWKDKGATVILSLRTLVHSTGRWEQFWKKVNQYGFPIAA